MHVNEAIDYVYASYMKAEPFLQYDESDDRKRNPKLTKAVLEKRSGLPTTLVTGSKGKGSVTKMIAEIMGAHRKVGMMTSPHITHFRERFQIDGKVISDEELANVVSLLKPEFDAIEASLAQNQYISPMGIQAAIALELFRQNKVDFQILECGKGVAYDDVGNVSHTYSVINRIFLEHTRELGKTLEDIAKNKSAIITGHEKAAFISEQEEEVLAVFRQKALETGVELYEYGTHFWCENIKFTPKGMLFDVIIDEKVFKNTPENEDIVSAKRDNLHIEGIIIPLLGTHQAKNCALALAMCIKELGKNIKIDLVKSRLAGLEWPGRMEILQEEPFILLDACINKESAKSVQEVLQELKIDKIASIVAIPKDKDFLGVTECMTHVSSAIFLTKTSNPHYAFGPEQVAVLEQKGVHCTWANSVENAIELAKQEKLPICILGTTSLISDVKAIFRKKEHFER